MRTLEQSALYLEKFAMRWHPWATFCAIFLLQEAVFREEAIFSLAATEGSETRKPGDNFWCPQKCACSTSARIVDCSSLGAVAVPEVHNQTTRLYLHNNDIGALVAHQFRALHLLTFLIISRNNISEVHRDAFTGLHSLKYLILDGNSISSLPPGVFRGLKHLETVSLAKNRIEVLPSGFFSHTRQLSMINLQQNTISSIHPGSFHGLEELHTLRLNDNNISLLPPNGLNIPSLIALYLNSNNLTVLPDVLLSNCSLLELLSLSHNKIKVLPDGVFTGCSSLEKLYLQGNQLTSLPPQVFHGLTSLEGVYISNNRLEFLPQGVFADATALNTVHVEGNLLSILVDGSFVNLPQLESIYLHNNNITEIQTGTFAGLPSLKYLVLYRNNIKFLNLGVLISLHSLQKIQLEPLPCSCKLAPLAVWVRRHHVRGLRCVREDRQVIPLTSLQDECHRAELILPDEQSEGSSTDTTVMESEVISARKHAKQIEQRGEELNSPKLCESDDTTLLQKLSDLRQTVAELTIRVSMVEAALVDPQSCQRWVCLHGGLRLEPGDQWRENGKHCACLQDGNVACF